MIDYTHELQGALDHAQKAGIEVEIYVRTSQATTIRIQDGEIDQFTLADSQGAGVRVIRQGRTGYAFTEEIGTEALIRSITSAAINAELLEEGPDARLEPFEGPMAVLDLERPALSTIPIPDKIERARTLERVAHDADPRIKNVTGSAYSDSHGMVRIVNTLGLDRSFRSSLAWMSTVPLLFADDQNKNYYQVKATRDYGELDPEAIAREAVARAAEKLGAREPRSGTYPVVLAPEAMADLLGVFSGIFSGKVALEGKSLLKGRLGETIAASCVTLVDDPMEIRGFGARPFDDEGCATRRLAMVENGVFTSFLHNSETARRFGVKSTGHAARSGYRGTLEVGAANLYLAPGGSRRAELYDAAEAVVEITEVAGLHAGANAISGDFSLQAQGFWHQGGERRPIHNFTVSGNFYQVLQDITRVGDDLEFFTSCIGSPSVRVDGLAIAGS